MLAKKYWPYLRQVACRKKTNFTLTKTIVEAKKYYRLTEMLAKKCDFYFYQNLCRKKTSRFWKPTKPTANTARKNDTANQNQRRPKRKRKTLKPISATRQNQPETMPTKRTPPNEKAENLKTCLLKNICPKTLFEKCHRQSREYIFMNWKPPR